MGATYVPFSHAQANRGSAPIRRTEATNGPHRVDNSNLRPDDVLLPLRTKAELGTAELRRSSVIVVQ